MSYSYLNQPVLASIICSKMDNDSFFSPAALAHTGFAFDGFMYTAGTKELTQASWSAEDQSDTRGPLQTYPTNALVVVNRASIAILDATQESTPLWMLFYLADPFGYPCNPLGAESGYLAEDVSWANGVLSLTLVADPGSTSSAPLILTIDFVNDGVGIKTRS